MYNPRGVKSYDKPSTYKKSFTYPTTKLKNITCVFCRHHFFIRDLNILEGAHIPLLLACGHASCSHCLKAHAFDPCPLCKNSLDLNNSITNHPALPVNIYVVGLLNICQDRPVHGHEPDISFARPALPRLMQDSINEGHCYECGIQAVLRCLQCAILFCHACFNKMHQFRKLQGHFKVLLPSSIKDSIFEIKTCPEHDNAVLEYYCNICNFATCPHCMLHYHKQHDHVPLAIKNEEFMDDLRTTQDKIAETLQRVHQTEKKLQKILLHPEKVQSSETIETAINQHFAHLHGVLQNCEKRMIDQIQEHRSGSTKNLKVIQQRLKSLDDQLQSALTMTADYGTIISSVNLSDVIPKLENLADSPCHLVEDVSINEEKIIFCPVASIIETIENHCRLELPEGPGYSLLTTEDLPENYELVPLNTGETSRYSSVSFTSNSSMMKRAWSCQSLSSRHSEGQGLRAGSYCHVELCHIEHPSNFYVRQKSCLSQIRDMEAKIVNYAKSAMIPCEVEQGKMYVVRNELNDKWYRGRVNAINTDDDDQETYEVFNVDYGSIEHKVPKSRMRYISEALMRMSQMVINCTIFDVVPKDGKWSPEANKIMIENLKPDKYVKMHIVNVRANTYFVDLCKEPTRNNSKPSSVRDTLVYTDHGRLTTQHKVHRTSPHAAQRYYCEKLALENYYDVYCSSVETPDCIHIQKGHEHLLYLAGFLEQLAAYYNDEAKFNDGLIHVPEIGLPCAVEKADKEWFRGIINDIPGSRMVEVLLVDSGQIITVTYDKIRRLHESFAGCPAQGIKVSLTDIKPCGEQWSQEVIDYLKKRLDGQFFRAFPFEKVNNGYNVALYTADNVNIATELVSKGLAITTGPRSSGISEATNNQPVTKIFKPKIYNNRTPHTRKKKFSEINNRMSKKLSSEVNIDPFKLQVKIIRVVSPDIIYVADSNNEDMYKQMMNEMQIFYNHYEEKMHDRSWNELIDIQCAIYSERDKVFCRGKIIAFKEPDEFEVFLSDLAIMETVKVSDVQTLESKFWQFPTFAFRVKLAGIYPCGGSSSWTSSSCNQLNDLINDNQSCKFYISKVDNVEKEDLSVDLWIEQTKIDGPLAPARIEINSINRMLVDLGLALPIRNYNNIKTRVLAVELKRHISHKTKGEKMTRPVKDGQFKKKRKNNGETMKNINSDEENVSIGGESVQSSEETETYLEEEISSTEPKLTSWLASEIIQDDTFIAMPTYVDNDCCLYLHSTRQSKNTLHFIESTLSIEYSKLEVSPSDLVWEKGDLCIAQYHANKKWYRAQVLRILDNNMIEVEFVDYGNIEECENGTLRKRLTLAHIPRISTKCVIYGLRPNTHDGKWKTKNLDRIHALVVDHECEVKVLRRKSDHLVISLILTNPTRCELITYLVKQLTMDVRTGSDDSGSSMNEMDSTMTENDDVVIEGYVKNFDEKVEKINDERPENESENINEIKNEKTEEYDKSLEEKEEKSESDGNFDVDEETVRDAQYNELESSINSEIPNLLSPENSIKTLLPDESEDPVDLTNLTYTTASDFISGTANFTHDPDYIEKSHQEALNQLECISLPENTCLKDKLVTSTPFNDTMFENARSFENLIIPNDVQVVKAEISTIHVFGLHMHILGNKKSEILTEYRNKYEMIMNDMQKCAENQPILESLEKDTPCCAKFVDGIWYRCSVITFQCDEDDVISMVKVSFVDFGNVDYVRIEEVRTIKEEWLEGPKMSLWCPLSKVMLNPSIDFSTGHKVAEKIRDAFEKDKNGKYHKSRPFYIKIQNNDNDLQSYEVYRDENCTELAHQSLIDDDLFINLEDSNDSEEL